MAKFCANCGSSLNETDRVCGNCGKPVPGTEAVKPSAEPAVTKNDKETKKSSKAKNIFRLIVAVVVLVIALVIAINIIKANTGYKGAVKKLTKALEKYDMDTLEDLASSISNEMYENWYGDEMYERYEDTVSDKLDEYEDNVGPIKKIKYEILDISEYSKRRINELEETLMEDHNIETGNIKEIIRLDLSLTIKGSKRSATYSVHDLYAIKESDGWKFYYGDLSVY